MSDRLKGRSAVVTGAGRGIGREIALTLAAEGANVVVVDPGVSRGGEGADSTPADEVVAEIKKRGGSALANHNSVADFRAAEEIINDCVKNFGRIDILVNGAGILREKMVWNLSEEDWDLVLAVHLKGTFNCSRHAAAVMRDQRYGRIINLVSTAWLGTVGQSNYGAAKGGMVSFTRAIARELGKYGVTCNCIAPMAATRMTVTEEVKAGMQKRYEAGLITQEALESFKNMPGPEYVPPIVVYLASDKAANTNGQVFHIERGRVGIYSHPVIEKAIYKREAEGMWSVDDLEKAIPSTLLAGYINPAPQEVKK